MSESPLPKPGHLGAPSSHEWLAKHLLGLVALVLGALSFMVVAVSQDQLWSTPDWRFSVPGFVLTLGASVGSLVRREHASALWLLGLGLASAALVLGMFVMLAIVIGATAVLILILHSVM